MVAPRILVVDDDPSIRRIITLTLERCNYEVVAATDGEDGLAKAKSSPPNLVVMDVNMPKMDGWTLIKNLRSLPEFALTPVIFLTARDSSDDRIQGYRLGADNFLAKPFNADELTLCVANALQRRDQLEAGLRKQSAQGSQNPSGIHGPLDQLGVASLLTILEMEQKTGVLVLEDVGRHETARLTLNNGQIFRARMDGRSEPQGRDVVYGLVAWTGGKFSFQPGPVDGQDEVATATTHLLLEAARLLDERHRTAPAIDAPSVADNPEPT